MANIRTFRDIRNENPNAARARGGASGYPQPTPHDDDQPQPACESLLSVRPSDGGVLPTVSDVLCPRWSIRTFTFLISIIQAVIFIITLIVGATQYDGAIVKNNSMLGPSASTLKGMGGKWTPDIQQGHIWRLITPIFLHAGFIHLFSNLFFQLRLGFSLEHRWGIPRAVALYFIAGIGGSLWSAELSQTTVSVGASGALAGWIGADISFLYFNWAVVPDNISEACFLSFVIIINILTGLGSQVDNWAHLGGFLTGIFAGLALCNILQERSHEKLERGIGWSLLLGISLLFILLIYLA